MFESIYGCHMCGPSKVEMWYIFLYYLFHVTANVDTETSATTEVQLLNKSLMTRSV